MREGSSRTQTPEGPQNPMGTSSPDDHPWIPDSVVLGQTPNLHPLVWDLLPIENHNPGEPPPLLGHQVTFNHFRQKTEAQGHGESSSYTWTLLPEESRQHPHILTEIQFYL